MNRFIMANSQQCLGCHACEVACVMAHNDERHVLTSQRYQPRITVIKHQRQRSAVTCHHCEDAPCARSCPNGAIAHINDSVQVNAQKCIGCKSCVVACPFGTMQMVLTPVAPNQFKASAHKCDLCQGREQGAACVDNCPADALQLVTEDSLTRLAKTRRLRTARQEIRPGIPWIHNTVGQQAAKSSVCRRRRRAANRINWRLKRVKPPLRKFICRFAPRRRSVKRPAASHAGNTVSANDLSAA